MNHSVSYNDFSPLAHDSLREHDELYEHIVAAVSDINLSLPSIRSLDISMTSYQNHHEVHIVQQETTISTYILKEKPGLFRRIMAQITLGFVAAERVEMIKTDIESRYTYGEHIIL